MAKKRRTRRTPGTGYAAKAANGTWTAFYPRADGGRHSRRGFSTREAAEAWCDSLVKQRSERLDVDKGRQTVGPRIDAWVEREAREAEWKAKTKADVQFKLGYPKALLGDMAMSDVMPDHIDAALTELARDLQPNTMRQIRNYLHRFFADAVERRHISYNPVLKPKRRKRPKQAEPERLTAPQAAALVGAVGQWAAAWWLIVCLGLRAGELCGLRRGDFDAQAATLTVAQEYTDLRGTAHQDLPKGDKTRTLPVPRAVVVILDAHLSALTKRAAKGVQAGTWQEHGLMFPGRSGRPMNPTSVRHALKRHTDTLRLPTVKTHGLRHTAGQLYTDAGCPEDIRAAILGHAVANVTRHYSPPSLETLRPWVERVYQSVAREVEQARKRA